LTAIEKSSDCDLTTKPLRNAIGSLDSPNFFNADCEYSEHFNGKMTSFVHSCNQDMKRIILTGGSSGIGKATAALLLREGHMVCSLSRSGSGHLSEGTSGENAMALACDVRDYNQVRNCCSEITERWGGADILINNAGVGYFDTIANGKIDEWHNMFNTNVQGLLNCIHVFLPELVKNSGQIINIGSVASHQVFPNSGIYCATKHAVWAISEAIRLELPDKVRITTISPGSVNTPFISSTSNEEMLRQYRDYFAAGLSPDVVATQILHAINTPQNAVITEIIVRPNRQVK
jgi:NADP-dependent 3-hydroxy acid dehydrogenase YdfG